MWILFIWPTPTTFIVYINLNTVNSYLDWNLCATFNGFLHFFLIQLMCTVFIALFISLNLIVITNRYFEGLNNNINNPCEKNFIGI